MAFLTDLLRNVSNTGLLGQGPRMLANAAPKGTGHVLAQGIANTGQARGLPEMGISEMFGAYQPQPLSPQPQGSSGPQVLSYEHPNNPKMTLSNMSYGSPSGGTGGISGGFNPQGYADTTRDSTMQGIGDRRAMMQDIIGRITGRAGDALNQFRGDVTGRYGDLIERARQRGQSALDTLGQEDLNVQNLYGRAAGTSRAAMESALRQNRVAARAQNQLGSSFYDERQSGARSAGAKSVSDIAAEEAAKRAGVSGQMTNTKNWVTQQEQDLEREQNQMINQAQQEYQRAIDQANDLERAYGIDSDEAMREADMIYRSQLDQIQNHLRNQSLATANQRGSAIDSYDAIPPQLRNMLANMSGLNNAQSTMSNLPMVGNITQGQGGIDALEGMMDPNMQAWLEDQRRRALLFDQ